MNILAVTSILYVCKISQSEKTHLEILPDLKMLKMYFISVMTYITGTCNGWKYLAIGIYFLQNIISAIKDLMTFISTSDTFDMYNSNV